MAYKFVGSPNYTIGRWGFKVKYVVIHWMVGTLASTDAVFQRTTPKNKRTSAHYGIEDKNIHQYVKEKNTAWHAGTGLANRQSIGIEHSAAPGRAPSAQTYETSAKLIAKICKDYKLDPDKAIVPHCKFVATRCPGTDKNGNVDEAGGVSINKLKKRVKELLKPKKKPTSKKKSLTTIAKEVIAGKWGNGDTRTKKLKKAGYDPKKVQAQVNKLLRG